MKESYKNIVNRIDEKMGKGWTKRLADVLSAPLTDKVNVDFNFKQPEEKDPKEPTELKPKRLPPIGKHSP